MSSRSSAASQRCAVCGQTRRVQDLYHGEMVRPAVAELIRRDHPEWTEADTICRACRDRYRAAYVEDLIESAKGEVTELEREVIESLHQHELIAQNVNEEFETSLTFGQRVSDRIAAFGGSWPFIFMFGAVLAVWIGVNSVNLLAKPFDPYPYILLNLALSCLAAVQAPVILMSQNRQAAKDRLRSEHDYRVNLKAELEIRHVTAMLELLMQKQWRRLLELQQIQVDMMQGVKKARRDS